jgi:oligoendopeptidase F
VLVAAELEIHMTQTIETPRRERTFVPNDLDVADWSQLQPLYDSLLERPIDSPQELEKWLHDFSELSAVVDEYGSRRYIDKSCRTEDPDIEKAYMHFVENIEPKIKPLFFQLQKKYLESPHCCGLDRDRYFVLDRKWKADVELFRNENVPIETEITKLVTEYDKVSGAMMVEFQGKTYTMQQMARFLEEPDRQLRQPAWETMQNRRMQDRQTIEQLFEKLLPMRQQIARNAGFDDYRGYTWKAYKRFDYTPEDCRQFAEAIEKTCVPLVDQLDRQRRQDLQLEKLRPWDLAVDPKNRPPLRPFQDDQTQLFIDRTKEVFGRISPQLQADFDSLCRCNNLDLDSRRGKQPGAYQCSLEESRMPFIFMNAAGLQRDVETLLHEGGHAFHCLAAAEEPLVFFRHAPTEFSEVASMAMELFGAEHFDVFYDEAGAARAKRIMIEGIVRFLPWMATIDQFQHWIYTHPQHTRQQRTDHWLSLLDRFASKVDWRGHEPMREAMWQRQLHLFHAPFYYIEYGIAQLGALQLWLKAKQDRRQALANYRAALILGGTRPLPELFSAAGIHFDFSPQTLGPLMEALHEELQALPR